MGRERRGVEGIRTMGALVDARRTRTAAGALLELSAMANEKLLLRRELDRWKGRHVEIRRRLTEIAAKERRLMAMVQAGPDSLVVGDLPAPGFATSATDGSIADGAPDAPGEPPPGRRVRVKEFTY